MHGNQSINGIPAVDNGRKMYLLTAPVRFLDTRAGQPACIMPSATATANTEYSYNIRTLCTGIPAEAKGIFGNVSVIGHAANGFLTIWPTGAVRPTTSSMNYDTDVFVVNVFYMCGLSGQGNFSIYSSQTLDVIVDIVGYLA